MTDSDIIHTPEEEQTITVLDILHECSPGTLIQISRLLYRISDILITRPEQEPAAHE